MFACTAPPMTCTVCTGALRSLAPMVKKPPRPDAVLMNRRGSCSQLPPAFKLCSSPPKPRDVQLTSSRSCHLVCSVVCGADPFAPPITPLGKISTGCVVLPGIALSNVETWKIRSFSFVPPKSQLSLKLSEWNVLLLVAQAECATSGHAPLGVQLPSSRYRRARE